MNSIHHITAIAGKAGVNAAFYENVLGLRMVKKTVNFDDPSVYHLYYGNQTGEPGTIITFFPWEKANPGIPGGGQAAVITFAVPEGSLGFWEKRLQAAGVETDRKRRFNDSYVVFDDPDGIPLELVERGSAAEKAERTAITGIAGVLLLSTAPEKTDTFFTEILHWTRKDADDSFVRYATGGDFTCVDVLQTAVERGEDGPGTIHHVAWRAADDKVQGGWKKKVEQSGVYVTPVRERQYFQAVYFRVPGGVLFEIATDAPGFLVDEPEYRLGKSLMLPSWLEPERKQVEASLPPLTEKNISN
ncbi:ring-cleaving dioxygenase [Alkalicoccus urumqiensis]|uniref:Ring-cleaving dioxygenase n=1 Tax=Alkalicoccus urumqiensis TaxID=1548213 RepID=A0A2P6MIU0_ALKUR|nr:ring-cleaving dioxygenase [Alkalicoccus urumqiensis]PRO66195.1 ring-cleaving dioxygenase [Alkalicoccus urumqiensis]